MLGHNWLTHYNPSIDWVLGSIKSHSPSQTDSLSTPDDALVNMTGVLMDCHESTDIFSKTCTYTSALHWPCDLKIELEEGTSPLFGLIYSLSQSELKSLQEFLDEHLAMHSTHPICQAELQSCSCTGKTVHSACVNFHDLNKIMKKDCYPLPCISDLLNSPCKARIYSKIDLCHAYLVCICKGDKWKTTFCTCYSSFGWHVMPFGLTNAPAAF